MSVIGVGVVGRVVSLHRDCEQVFNIVGVPIRHVHAHARDRSRVRVAAKHNFLNRKRLSDKR